MRTGLPLGPRSSCRCMYPRERSRKSATGSELAREPSKAGTGVNLPAASGHRETGVSTQAKMPSPGSSPGPASAPGTAVLALAPGASAAVVQAKRGLKQESRAS